MTKNYFFTLLILVFLAGCGGQSYEYQDATEMKPGTGLLSGDEGEIYLIKAKEKKDGEELEGSEEDKKE